MTARPPQPRPTITVWQPYASLIMHGIKTFETRPSEPGGDARPPGSDRYPGLDLNPGDALWIHAAKRKLREGERFGRYETIEYTNNHGPGISRTLFCPVDPRYRTACECKTDETLIVEADGYAWTTPTDGPCTGCYYETLFDLPCPIHHPE